MDDLFTRISETVQDANTTESLTRALLELLQRVTGLESTYLTRVDEAAGVQTVLYACNGRGMDIPENFSVPWHDTLCRRALAQDHLVCTDVSACWPEVEAAKALKIATYITTPLRLADGTLVGTLCGTSRTPTPVTEEGRQVLTLFGMLILRQIERETLLAQLHEANRQLERQSRTDPLTGLPNRRALLHEMERLFAMARRVERTVLVAFLDLDGFKAINDQHGHDAGDRFLVQIGRRLEAGLRNADCIGRLGGDEFVAIGLGPPLDDGPQGAVHAWHARLTPLTCGEYDLETCRIAYPGASVGVISADPRTLTPEDALRLADAAMYEDKRRRREAVTVS
ncbi:GGDEF domain-containing protein [Novosphingobium pokkalii]|uniref:diguanylate cyclase n=1 Tax=Novosphingobium pokkalii TaxID=1770194 RepID=A0ABV7V465_9SPHN|nr:sensor domain-containing diguanylate cyclase [Novosphingobium pokkalii]GHC90998.1 diguanylate cyclase [Novosphingobium pokkalii]